MAEPTVAQSPSTTAPGGRRRPYVIAAAGVVVAAILVSGQTYLSMLHHGHAWWRLFMWQLLSWSFWGAVAPTLMAAGERLEAETPERRSEWAGWLLRHSLVTTALVCLHQLVAAGVTAWLQPFEPVEAMDFPRALEYLTVPWAFVDIAVYWLLIALGYALAAQRRRRELELRESRLETELARAQLQALRLELQPHFLFNTLNSIAALVRKRSNDEALEMVLGLSHLLRLTLDRSDRQLVPLREELAFVRRYVELQRQRFADRLRVSYDVDPSCESFDVPTLLLQPLVENAIRYGIADRPDGGTIEICAQCERGELRIRIGDDGPGWPRDFDLQNAGIGLGSTRSRLEQLFGEAAQLRLFERPGGGAMAEIVVPIGSGTDVGGTLRAVGQ